MLWTIFIFNKLKRYQISDIEDIGQRYQLVYSCKVLNTSVSFRYQLKRLYDVLSWSVSLRYQFVHHHNISNWSVLSTFQQDVAKTSLIGLPYWRTSCDVVMMSQHCQNWSVKGVNLSWILGSTLFGNSSGSVSLRYQLVRRYNVSVSFRY